MMSCPECGKPILDGQNYCRECGTELIADRHNRARVGGVVILGVMFAGLLVAIFGKMFEMPWLKFLGLVVLLTGAFVIAAYAYLGETRPRKRAKVKIPPKTFPSADLIIEKADTTNKLLPVGVDDYIPSVIDDTTELLETPAKRSQQRQ